MWFSPLYHPKRPHRLRFSQRGKVQMHGMEVRFVGGGGSLQKPMLNRCPLSKGHPGTLTGPALQVIFLFPRTKLPRLHDWQ